MLRKIFGSKREEATGSRRKLCNLELRGLYSSLNSIRVVKARRMLRAGRGTYWEKRNFNTSSVGELKERTTWKNYSWMWDHINVNLKEAGLDSVNFIYLPQKR